jgi:hypothetical protein
VSGVTKGLAAAIRASARAVDRPLADALFVVLLFAVVIAAGWLAARHDRYWDWTRVRTNSLTAESQAILARIDAPLRMTVFIAPQDPRVKGIDRLLARYRRELPRLEVRFVDPQRFPEQTRDARVSSAGQTILEYRGRRELLGTLSERSVSAAIARLGTTRAPWIAVLEGHGERLLTGEAQTDLGRFGDELKDRGYLLRSLDLTMVADVPVNTHLLLISTPAIPLFPGEADRLGQYLDRGGNLLWLMDPGPLNGLEVLADALGLGVLPGTVVDAAAARFDPQTPAVAVIADYPDDALAGGLTAPALLPGTVAFEPRAAPGWTLAGYLTSSPDSWNETGRLAGNISRDEVVGEQDGPLPVVLALTRNLPEEGRVQRVLVVGDGDFLSNAQIGAYGNRALALKLLRWVSGEDGLLPLPPDAAPIQGLELDHGRRLVLGVGALVLLPGLFAAAGLAIRWARSRA